VAGAQLSGDLIRLLIGQDELSAEDDQSGQEADDRQNRHQQAQAGQGRSALGDNLAGGVAAADQADHIQADAGQEHGEAGSQLDDEGLHGEDDGFIAVAGLHLAVVDGIGQEHRGQDRQHAVGREDQDAAQAQHQHVVSQAGEAAGQDQDIADHGKNQAEAEDVRVAHLLAQQRIQQHHAQDLGDAADHREQRVVALPGGAGDVILEEIDDQVGGDVQRAVDQHDRQHGDHRLVVLEQRLEHLADAGGLHAFLLEHRLFLDDQAHDGFKDHEQDGDDQGDPLEAGALHAAAEFGHQHDREDGDQRIA